MAGGEASAQRILEEPPPDLLEYREDAPPELVGLMFALLAKDPEQRPADARSVAHTLDAILLDVASAGGRTDTGEYLERLFGAERLELKRDVATALAALDTTTENTPAPAVLPGRSQHPAPPRRYVLMAVAGVVCAGAAWAWLGGGVRQPPVAGAPPASVEISAAVRPQQAAAQPQAAEPAPEASAAASRAAEVPSARGAERAPVRSPRAAAAPSPRPARNKPVRDEAPRLWNW